MKMEVENMRITKEDLPACNHHSDCFANREGKCITLTDTSFKRGDCPFYKTEKQLNAERKLDKKPKTR